MGSNYAAHDLVRVPGLLSLSRIPLAALFPLALGRPPWALAILATAGATDLLDGWYARRFHQQTSTGAVLDGVTDKIFVLTVVLSLLVSGSMSVVEMLLLGTRDLGELAYGLRLLVGRRKRDLTKPRSANTAGKIATLLQYVAVVAIILGSGPRSPLIGLAAAVGVLASVLYWIREEKALIDLEGAD